MWLQLPGRDTGAVERFRCAECGNELSLPVRRVDLPPQPDDLLLTHYRPNPPLLQPGTYAVDHAEYGRDRLAGTFVLSPGDARGMRFVHELVRTGCWSLVGSQPCLECDGCGTLVASRTDDCDIAQDTRLLPDVVICEDAGAEAMQVPDPYALAADWDQGGAPTTPFPTWVFFKDRRRPELLATRWRARGLKSDLYRDDPPT